MQGHSFCPTELTHITLSTPSPSGTWVQAAQYLCLCLSSQLCALLPGDLLCRKPLPLSPVTECTSKLYTLRGKRGQRPSHPGAVSAIHVQGPEFFPSTFKQIVFSQDTKDQVLSAKEIYLPPERQRNKRQKPETEDEGAGKENKGQVQRVLVIDGGVGGSKGLPLDSEEMDVARRHICL